jgi:hypothetical protein
MSDPVFTNNVAHVWDSKFDIIKDMKRAIARIRAMPPPGPIGFKCSVETHETLVSETGSSGGDIDG